MKRISEGRARLSKETGIVGTDIELGIGGIKTDMAGMLTELRKVRKEMADGARAERMRFVNELATYVSDLLNGFRNNRKEMTAMTMTERAEFVFGLRKSVSELRETVAAMRQEFAEELEGARGAFSRMPHAQRKAMETTSRREGDQEGQRAAAPRSEREKAEPAGKVATDDLTAIHGIGPGRMKRLNEAGIHTFAQMAHSTLEDMRQILGKMLDPDAIEQWRRQARELAES